MTPVERESVGPGIVWCWFVLHVLHASICEHSLFGRFVAHSLHVAVCTATHRRPPGAVPTTHLLVVPRLRTTVGPSPQLAQAHRAWLPLEQCRWLDCRHTAQAGAQAGSSRLGSAMYLCFEHRGSIGSLHLIKHAVLLRCSCLQSTHRCAQQRHSLELHQASDGSGAEPWTLFNGTVTVGGSRSLTDRCLIRLCLVY
mmetsp:Transcript_47269/g.94203  ORF Transcript_47269/g.94203 Transcript_47269/m.94203 type:complete len:197 (-) Transcript_47269:33-623(-)